MLYYRPVIAGKLTPMPANVGQKEFEEVHKEGIVEVLGDDGVWFNTGELIAVGEK